MSQQTQLFSGTICQNIACGHADYDLAQVQKAAEVANASEFIQQLPQGLHTYIAHHLTTVLNAGRIFVVEQGQIVESGTHQQLISKSTSRYASFHAQQLM